MFFFGPFSSTVKHDAVEDWPGKAVFPCREGMGRAGLGDQKAWVGLDLGPHTEL